MFLLLGSCVKENRSSYKKNDLFGEFEAQQGFVIMNLPPVLFKIVLNSSDKSDLNQKELLDKIELIKVLFFEENDKSMKKSDLNNSLSEKITNQNYNLLTQITNENNKISIFVKDEKQIISELLFLIVSDDGLFCVDCLGSFKTEDALKLYKSINTENLKISN
ncbi:MAG: hypothetical protein A2X00_16025 [Bacteroidetes bacterium GWE2_32_14]|nr:MAG: hypothetical protein A2X00_16025 [Bacteroidetes bacterium GWE2_32_14]